MLGDACFVSLVRLWSQLVVWLGGAWHAALYVALDLVVLVRRRHCHLQAILKASVAGVDVVSISDTWHRLSNCGGLDGAPTDSGGDLLHGVGLRDGWCRFVCLGGARVDPSCILAMRS